MGRQVVPFLYSVVFFEAQVSLSRFPLIADLHQHGRDESQSGRFRREESGDASASLHLLVHSLQAVGRSQQPPMRLRQAEDRQPLGQVRLHPRRQFGRTTLVTRYHLPELLVCRRSIRRVKDAADVGRYGEAVFGGDRGLHLLLGHIGLRVLLQMELTALLGHGTEPKTAPDTCAASVRPVLPLPVPRERR